MFGWGMVRMDFQEELNVIAVESGASGRDLARCLESCRHEVEGLRCGDVCYAHNPGAVSPETKEKIAALLKRYAEQPQA